MRYGMLLCLYNAMTKMVCEKDVVMKDAIAVQIKSYIKNEEKRRDAVISQLRASNFVTHEIPNDCRWNGQ